jgi:hypothetical protein
MKQFIFEMNEQKICKHSLLCYSVTSTNALFLCQHEGMMCTGKVCAGDLKNRPEWCPLVEHDTSKCAAIYDSEMQKRAYEATRDIGKLL